MPPKNAVVASTTSSLTWSICIGPTGVAGNLRSRAAQPCGGGRIPGDGGVEHHPDRDAAGGGRRHRLHEVGAIELVDLRVNAALGMLHRRHQVSRNVDAVA